MHGRLVASFLAAGVLLVSTAIAGTSPLQDRAYEVRSAIPAAIAYYADHGTWRGVTVGRLRRYDSSIKNVVVRRATKTGFCIQSTKTPFAHYDGPAGNVRKGRCGVRGAVIPFVPRAGSTPPTCHHRGAATPRRSSCNGSLRSRSQRVRRDDDRSASQIRRRHRRHHDRARNTHHILRRERHRRRSVPQERPSRAQRAGTLSG